MNDILIVVTLLLASLMPCAHTATKKNRILKDDVHSLIENSHVSEKLCCGKYMKQNDSLTDENDATTSDASVKLKKNESLDVDMLIKDQQFCREQERLKNNLQSRVNGHPSPLIAAWAQCALQMAADAIVDSDTVRAKEWEAEAKTIIDIDNVLYVAPPANICPPIPHVKSNPHWNAICMHWQEKIPKTPRRIDASDLIKNKTIEKIASETIDWTFAFCHPKSPLRSDPRVLNRIIPVIDTYMKKFRNGGARNFGDEYVVHAYLLLRSTHPDLLVPTRRGIWDMAIRSNVEGIKKDFEDMFRHQRRELLWGNGHVHDLVTLGWSSLILNDGRYRELGDSGLKLFKKSQLPDGGYSYVGFQNEAFTYHKIIPIGLAWYGIATNNSSVWDQLKKTRNYNLLSYLPRGVGDYCPTTMMKQYWNQSRPGEDALIAAYLNGDGYNMSVTNPKAPSLLGAFLYRPNIDPKVHPKDWLVYDRNIIGPNGRYGDFSFTGTTRDPSAISAPAQNYKEKAIGNFTSGFVGAITLMSDDNVQLSVERKNSHADERWPLSAAIQNITCEVKIKKGRDSDISRRSKHRFMAQCQRNAVSMGHDYSGLTTVYNVSDKITGAVSKFRALPWEGRQAWILTKNRLVGLLSIEATADHENWGVHGTLMMVAGRQWWGNKREMVQSGDGTYSYGNLLVKVLEHDFKATSTEYTDAFAGDAKKATRLILWDNPKGPKSEKIKKYKAGDSHFWMVEVRPQWTSAAKKIHRLKNLPASLWGIRLEEEKRDVLIIHNRTENAIHLKASFSVRYHKCSLHFSSDHSWGFRNAESAQRISTTESIGGGNVMNLEGNNGSLSFDHTVPPWSHILVVSSDNAIDHLKNNKVCESVFN